MMTDQGWRVLAEQYPDGEADSGPALEQCLAAAARELALSAEFVERVQAGLAGAVRRAFSSHDGHAPHRAVALRVSVTVGEGGQPGWGFFVVEKGAEAGDRHCIELFLYRG